ncbi:MAG: ankyrin repeat domain-containing protein [Desulfomonilaceae bacterium]
MRKVISVLVLGSLFLWVMGIGQVNAAGPPAGLIRAVKSGNVEQVSHSLSSGADPNTQGPLGNSVLILATFRGDKEIVKMLLEKGADVSARNQLGNTALMIASRRSYPEVVKLLLDKGADPNAVDPNGLTALQIAERWNRPNIVGILKPLTRSADEWPVKGASKSSR